MCMAKDPTRREFTPEELAEQAVEGRALRRIFEARKRAGLPAAQSQGALGAAAGDISQGMVGHFMSGTRRISKEQAVNLAHALGCSVSEFSPRLSNEIMQFAIAAIAAESTSDNLTKQALERFVKLGQTGQEAALKYLNFLAENQTQEAGQES